MPKGCHSVFVLSLAYLYVKVIVRSAIQKVTSGELLTKQTMRKNVIIYKKYIHT
jgi:hypothetical protein